MANYQAPGGHGQREERPREEGETKEGEEQREEGKHRKFAE